MALTSHRPIGRNIYDYDWDLIVVLDACRVDALREVAGEYSFLGSVDRAPSLGSSSKEWLVNTFQDEYRDEISDTVYLTGNGWVDEALTPSVDFASWTVLNGSVVESSDLVHRLIERPIVPQDDFDEVWMQPIRNVGGIEAFPAADLTEYAVQYGRVHDPERMIVHYMQPHEPYLHRAANGEEPTEIDKRPFELLRRGHEKEPVWNAYLDNLRYVLDHAEILLENYEADDVIITADHGEMFGEHLLYGHAEGLPHPKLRTVPWVTTSGSDTGTLDPDVDLDAESKAVVDDRLSALGYM
ncbi:alkaline phosphatase family protein [Halococcus agarilyticus]|uniref:hypothetical protein n=1 Tax=Halococcus agarilyticus TaxID=1232219 RepID=UPI0012ABB253|nr:hypothetical protein [Halococcus agarilyticus]